MTVTYSADIGTATSTAIVKLFFRWKGSLWKTVLPELCVWCIGYAILSAIYRAALSEASQLIFERVCVLFYTFAEYIPLNFILGFYVTSVYGRWNNYVNNIGWIDTPCLFVASEIQGSNDEARLLRRNIIRYLMIVQTMVFRRISIRVKHRFPTDDHLVSAGLMTKAELDLFNSIKSPHSKFWVAAEWAFNLVRIAREKGYIRSDIVYTQLMDKLGIFRSQVLNLFIFDWIPMPLVYTQCVSLAVRMYFAFALLGRQYLVHEHGTPHSKTIDLYVPILTICQFIFYVGWMKVAEVMINPMGEDDEDFELNYLLDRNLQVHDKNVPVLHVNGTTKLDHSPPENKAEKEASMRKRLPNCQPKHAIIDLQKYDTSETSLETLEDQDHKLKIPIV